MDQDDGVPETTRGSKDVARDGAIDGAIDGSSDGARGGSIDGSIDGARGGSIAGSRDGFTLGSRTTDERPAMIEAALQSERAGDRYKLGHQLGRGGMGEVLEAHDAQIGRDVAIKRMRAEEPSEKQIQRFMREARIQGRLEHPAIVPVHELGLDHDGKPYFAMKRLTGITLAKIIEDGVATRESRASMSSSSERRYPLQRLLRALADVCLAVELAHTRGFVHRDLKPENIMLGDFGETYVLDWGVAKVRGEDDVAFENLDASELVTAAGVAVGTPGYMSPEQARGVSDIDGRADVYSLGCVLFEVLTGQRLHPKGQEGMVSAVKGIDGRPSNRTPDKDIPPELDELCVRALETDRERRIETARELGEGIQQFLDGDRDLVLRRSLARTHLSAANLAFAGGDRAKAMREAGRALALDPTLHAAGELITRMMLEPPAVLPPEVKKAFDHESSDVVRRTLNVGAMASAGYLFFVPVLALLGRANPMPLILLTAASAAAIVMLLWARKPGRRFVAVPVIAMHLLMIVVVGRIGSPFLMGACLAAITAIGLMTGPQYAKRQATWIALLTIGAVLGPFIAEQAGWISSTMTVVDGGLMIHSSVFRDELSTYTMLVMYVVFLIAAGVMMTRGMRIAERSARRHMHVQAWQLRQLVADGAD